MRGDQNYSALVEFLSQLLQKVQNLETGNYSRTEIELFVRQFQDYNEGFHYRMDSKSRGKNCLYLNYAFLKPVYQNPFLFKIQFKIQLHLSRQSFLSVDKTSEIRNCSRICDYRLMILNVLMLLYRT